MKRESVVGRESVIMNKNGDIAMLSVSATPLFDDSGGFVGAVELFRDVTDMKRQERARKNILARAASARSDYSTARQF